MTTPAAPLTPDHTYRRCRHVVCPLLRLNGQPARRLSRDQITTDGKAPPWLRASERACLGTAPAVGADWAYDVCLSTWSRDCVWRPQTNTLERRADSARPMEYAR